MDKFSPKRAAEKRKISLHLSAPEISEIDAAATKAGLSRNAFICQCIDFALANHAEAKHT